jgi:hypothetical protein
VESRVISDLITGTCDGHAAPVRLLYDSADPFAIRIDISALVDGIDPDAGPTRPWMFARTILADALTAGGRYGLHDVVVARDPGSPWVTITIGGPDGFGGESSMDIRVGHRALLRFLERTAALVPLGRESEHLDVDAAIAQLFGGVS